MNRHHRPVPFPGPIPAGMMRVSADVPMEMWEDMKQARPRPRCAMHHAMRVVMLSSCRSSSPESTTRWPMPSTH